ncbi:unnamed protein product [Urochloa humidicola]
MRRRDEHGAVAEARFTGPGIPHSSEHLGHVNGGELEQRIDLVATADASEAAGERGRTATGSIRRRGGPSARFPARAATRPGARGTRGQAAGAGALAAQHEQCG